MNDLERLVLAALLHDLPALVSATNAAASKALQSLLDLGQVRDSGLAAIVQQAEAYAGGNGDLVIDRPLISIFSKIQLSQAQEPSATYHKLISLPSTSDDAEGLFCDSKPDVSGLVKHAHNLASALGWLVANVDMAQFEHVYHHLLAILQRYGWCLPSHRDDIGFFDHAKLTSAIAACLYRYHEGNLNVEAVQAGVSQERFCLLVGDLSGIQDYIFGITTIGAGGVARRLRARSFQLSVLSDVISHQITSRFGLPLGNVIMSSGGKFYVLLPNLGDVDAAVREVRRQIDTWFRERFNAEIALNVAHACFAGDLFQASSASQSGFGDLLFRLSTRLNHEKRRRGQSALTSDEHWDESAFVMKRDFWGIGACVSCGKFPANRTENLCEHCERDVQIGKRLPRARYVAYYRSEQPDAIPMPAGYSVRVLTHDELSQVGQPYLLTKLNDPDIRELTGHAGSFRYLANHIPVDQHQVPLSFEDIAGAEQGRRLLGYVKADVDYLGILFAQGLRRDLGGFDTAAHIAALSRELDLFFSGWMQHLLSETSKYQKFYTVFSGGDDLFLVGPWDKASGLAVAVRDAFARFVGRNPEITLSAGILFAKERYPISRTAGDAEEVLELSKERSDEQGRKRNQITLLGNTFRWEEAPHIFAEIETLQTRSKHLTSAFLYDLIEYGRLYRLWADEGKIEGLRYKPLFAYNIARNLRKDDEELRRWADGLIQSLHGGSENLAMRHLGLIATYLLFARRGSGGGGDRD